MLEVIDALPVFAEIGEVAIELGRPLDNRIRPVAQPATILGQLMSLPGQTAGALSDSENVGRVAEDARVLRRENE